MLDGAAKLKDLCNNRSHYPQYIDPDTGRVAVDVFAQDHHIGKAIINKAGKERWQFPSLTIDTSWNTILLSFRNVSFELCTIKGVNFVGCDFQAVDFATWIGDTPTPTMDNVQFTQTSITKTMVSGGANNFHFLLGTLSEVTFDSNVEQSSFAKTKLSFVKFEEGISGCRFENLEIIGGLIFHAEVTGNTFKNVRIDGAGCSEDVIEFDYNRFQDCMIGSFNCPSYTNFAAIMKSFEIPGTTLNSGDFSGRRMNGNSALGVNY